MGIFGQQRRVGVLLVKIFVDDAGLEKDLPGVIDHRYFAIRVELQEFGPLLVLFCEIESYPVVRKTFFM